MPLPQVGVVVVEEGEKSSSSSCETPGNSTEKLSLKDTTFNHISENLVKVKLGGGKEFFISLVPGSYLSDGDTQHLFQGKLIIFPDGEMFVLDIRNKPQPSIGKRFSRVPDTTSNL